MLCESMTRRDAIPCGQSAKLNYWMLIKEGRKTNSELANHCFAIRRNQSRKRWSRFIACTARVPLMARSTQRRCCIAVCKPSTFPGVGQPQHGRGVGKPISGVHQARCHLNHPTQRGHLNLDALSEITNEFIVISPNLDCFTNIGVSHFILGYSSPLESSEPAVTLHYLCIVRGMRKWCLTLRRHFPSIVFRFI